MGLSAIIVMIFNIVVPIVTMVLAPVAGVSLLSNKKNLKVKRRLVNMAALLIVPPLGIALTFLARKQPPEGMEREEFNQHEKIDAAKKKIDKLEEKIDLMKHGKIRSSDRRLQRMEFELSELKANLKDNLVLLGSTERKIYRSTVPRYIPVFVSSLVDGSNRYDLPYDLPREKMNDIKLLLSKEHGLNVMDNEHFGISEKGCQDMDYVGMGKYVIVYDDKTGKLNSYGCELSEETEQAIKKSNQLMCFELGVSNDYDFPDALSLKSIGNGAAALYMNGVALAYAVSGPEGTVRMIGDNVVSGDKSAKMLASKLNAELCKCPDMASWVSKASEFCLSRNNMMSARESLKNVRQKERSRKELKKMRMGILNAPKQSVKRVGMSIS